MVDRAQVIGGALNFMDRARELLDNAGERNVAVHLQQAIDVARGAPVPRTIAEAEAMLLGYRNGDQRRNST